MRVLGLRIARRNLALAAMLVALLLAWAWPRGAGPAQREIVRLAAALVPADVGRVELTGRGADERVTLARESAGARPGPWRIEELFGFPAESFLVEQVLERLASLTTLDLLTDDATRHGEYGLEEGAAQRLVARAFDGAVVADVFIGRGSTGSSYVRCVGEAAVYGAPALPRTPRAAEAWRRASSLVRFEPVLVRAVSIERAGDAAPLRLERDLTSVSEWRDGAGGVVRGDAVSLLLRELAGLFPERVLAGAAAPEHGLEAPAFAVELTLHDTSGAATGSGVPRRITFGAADIGGLVPTATSEGPWIVGVRRTGLERVEAAAGALRAR